MDPIGLVLESFDSVGVHRAREAGRPIDTSGSIRITDARSVQVANPTDLAQALAKAPEVSACFVSLAYEYARQAGDRGGRVRADAYLGRVRRQQRQPARFGGGHRDRSGVLDPSSIDEVSMSSSHASPNAQGLDLRIEACSKPAGASGAGAGGVCAARFGVFWSCFVGAALGAGCSGDIGGAAQSMSSRGSAPGPAASGTPAGGRSRRRRRRARFWIGFDASGIGRQPGRRIRGRVWARYGAASPGGAALGA
jgi:hypothetical protein